MKQIFIVNGMAGAGKDTFAEILNDYVAVYKVSIIGKVKDIAQRCGWNGKSKTEKDRKFLSDLKTLTDEYNDMSFSYISDKVRDFQVYKHFVGNADVMLIDMRSPEDIDRAKKEFGAKTVFIENNRVKNIDSNPADANVFNYTYDYIIQNNGTIEEFKKNIKNFVVDAISLPNLKEIIEEE